MKNIIIILIFFSSYILGNNQNITGIYAIGVFHENKLGENIQHLRETNGDYNGTCYSKVFVLSKSENILPKVTIGNSIGHFIKKESIFNSKKIKIGEELLYKHYNVTSGYIEVKYKNKLYDTKVFVK